MKVLGDGNSGMHLGHEDGALIMGLVPLNENDSIGYESSLCLSFSFNHVRINERVAIYKLGHRLSTDTTSVSTLISDFSVFRTVRSKCYGI